MRKTTTALISALLVAGCAMSPPTVHSQLQEQVIATERALAESMARRDHAAFTSYISDEAMFFSDTTVHRGRAAIAAAWAPLFEGKTAPFSWTPGQVEVLNSGQLALSTGPVLDARGKLVGTFTSIWRREPTGDWRIVFDKGNDVCPICGGSR